MIDGMHFHINMLGVGHAGGVGFTSDQTITDRTKGHECQPHWNFSTAAFDFRCAELG
jgi:hypothetical protein